MLKSVRVPWCPVTRTWSFHCQGPGSITSRGVKIMQTSQHSHQKKKYIIHACVIIIYKLYVINLSSVQFSHTVVSDSLQLHGLQYTRLPCPSPTPRACSNSCPSSRRCHPTISFSVVPLLLLPSIFPSIRVFSMSQLFASAGKVFLPKYGKNHSLD